MSDIDARTVATLIALGTLVYAVFSVFFRRIEREPPPELSEQTKDILWNRFPTGATPPVPPPWYDDPDSFYYRQAQAIAGVHKHLQGEPVVLAGECEGCGAHGVGHACAWCGRDRKK